jgi:dihydrofolate synthase / folylpolyglutamate synthase
MIVALTRRWGQTPFEMKQFPTALKDWLALLESRHAETHIDMGLDRVRAVKEKMRLAFSCPVIMVAGTNGKGSTCAMLESILLQGGYRVGLYIKPHFLDFNPMPPWCKHSTPSRPAVARSR